MTKNTPYSTPMRWGIVGAGDVTEVKSGPAYQLTEGFELAAVMRRDEAKLRDYAVRHGVQKTYTDADALINDPDIDAVYIATPPDTHRHFALKVAAAGKPCCVEKPLAPSYADSRAIYQAFASRDLPLFSAYYRRSMPRFTRVAQWLNEGEIGDVRHLNRQLSKPPSPQDLADEPNWRTDPKIAPGGYFDDLASHDLDLFTFLLGDVTTAHGISLNQQKLYGAKDAFSACWQHQSGVTGAGYWNFGCAQHQDRVTILGSEGTIEFSVFEDEPLVLTRRGHERLEEMIEHSRHVHLYHVENMRRQLIDGDFNHPSTGKTALHTSWVMDRILGRVGG